MLLHPLAYPPHVEVVQWVRCMSHKVAMLVKFFNYFCHKLQKLCFLESINGFNICCDGHSSNFILCQLMWVSCLVGQNTIFIMTIILIMIPHSIYMPSPL